MFVLKTKSKSLSIFPTFGLQIVEQTPTMLKLQAKGNSIRLFMLLLGIPFFLAGLSIIIFFGKLTTLKCNRLEATQVACELTTSSLLGGHITPIPTGQPFFSRKGVEVSKVPSRVLRGLNKFFQNKSNSNSQLIVICCR